MIILKHTPTLNLLRFTQAQKERVEKGKRIHPMTLTNSHQADQAVPEKVVFCDLKKHPSGLPNPRRSTKTTGSQHLMKFKIIFTQYLIYTF